MSNADEVRSAVSAYDAALRAGQLDEVDSWFLRSAGITRFGISSVAYGFGDVSAGRRDPRTASPPPTDRVDGRHELLEIGHDVVVATLEHRHVGDQARRRRTQIWWRISPGEWRIVHAHISAER